MFDVIVVGAGPAGGAAAYHLARAGARVLLLEKKRLPRFKPCGGGTSQRFLESLPFDVSRAVRGRIQKVRYFFRLSDPFDVRLDASMTMLNRQLFDLLLAEAAGRAGAVIKDGVAVTEISQDRSKVSVRAGRDVFEARYLIGADGVLSRVGRSCGLIKSNKVWIAMDAELIGCRQEPDTAFFGFGQLPSGYSWSFPKSDFYSVGIGGRPQRQMIAEMKKWIDFLGFRVDKGSLAIRAHPLPDVRPGARLSRGRILLVGDAAGLVDPLSGEGIRFAIRSAGIAAGTILRERLTDYDRTIFNEISADFRFAKFAKMVFCRWPEFCYRFAVKDPVFSRIISLIFSGELSYRRAGRMFFDKYFNPLRRMRKR